MEHKGFQLIGDHPFWPCHLRVVSKHLSATDMAEASKDRCHGGLRNLGTTCYLASVIQCLRQGHDVQVFDFLHFFFGDISHVSAQLHRADDRVLPSSHGGLHYLLKTCQLWYLEPRHCWSLQDMKKSGSELLVAYVQLMDCSSYSFLIGHPCFHCVLARIGWLQKLPVSCEVRCFGFGCA